MDIALRDSSVANETHACTFVQIPLPLGLFQHARTLAHV